MTDEQFQFYVSFLQERHSEFCRSLDALYVAITENNQEEKKSRLHHCLTSLRHLHEAFGNPHRPPWITLVMSELNKYRTSMNGVQASSLIKALIPVWQNIQEPKWESIGNASDLDFDGIWIDVYSQSQAEELFETLIRQLQELVDCGAIDSIRAIKALNELIRVFKQNSRRSYSAAQQVWFCLGGFVGNYLNILGEEHPTVGPIVKAAKLTWRQYDDEMVRVRQLAENRINSIGHERFAALESKPELLPPNQNIASIEPPKAGDDEMDATDEYQISG